MKRVRWVWPDERAERVRSRGEASEANQGWGEQVGIGKQMDGVGDSDIEIWLMPPKTLLMRVWDKQQCVKGVLLVQCAE